MISFSLNSISFSCFAILASAVVISIVFLCSCCWISYAASASAFLTSAALFNSCFLISSSLFLSAIAVSASILASFAISLSDSALDICADLLMLTTLSIPRFSITFPSSVTFWTLKLTISRPILAISGAAFSCTFSANIFLS